ncbi:hypothetical protein LYSHEL_09190 [Lysobacter helvus]|uniref:DUF5329 domain-containing protein n=2 Tax=Lysobacteraceae TaxID=32033 RepID=A0ABM7Q3Z4_9GAMM|nr:MULTISPECIES: DUF5329 family protein [Lysobacter]BCT91895.1 hypothetical protein LYSCAS_09190 [Lysobacter caseinilyticus]BCT95048.1 hypothetical protein LYSHEL_09190 [Lysobacter helvus]
MNLVRRRFVAAFLALATTVAFAAPARTPAQEIDALIQRVAAARGVAFIRNGSEYTAQDAAKHLRRKLGAANGKITTPEQFIAELGTKSSMSGKVYRVRLADGREMDSAVWLKGLLRDLRAGR